MFKCQKQVETAAYSNPILSVTLETSLFKWFWRNEAYHYLETFPLDREFYKGACERTGWEESITCTLNYTA